MMLTLDAWLQQYEHITMFVTMLLWMAYVWYTVKTFQQIRTQTENQTKAFLAITREEIFSEDALTRMLGMDRIHGDVSKLYEKWKTIVSSYVPDALSAEPEQLWIVLKNVGASDILEWRVDLEVRVEPGPYLHQVANTSGETLRWSVSSDDLIRRYRRKRHGICVSRK